MPVSRFSHGMRLAAALVGVYLVWGSTYAALRVMVETIPPWIGAGSRFVLAGGLLLGAVAVRGGPALLRMDRRQLASCALIGLLRVTLGNGLLTVAERDATSRRLATHALRSDP
jgi:drug/metabolite transporter (DMT)-like permease